MTKSEQHSKDVLPTLGILYIHPFYREDLTAGDGWYDYVVSTSPVLSENWRHIKEEDETVIDWCLDLTFLLTKKYPGSILVQRKDC